MTTAAGSEGAADDERWLVINGRRWRRTDPVHGEERADWSRLELFVGHVHCRDTAKTIRNRRIERVDS